MEMTKLEKVLKGLECCMSMPQRLEECKAMGCPYVDEEYSCNAPLCRDALELLKAVPPDAREVWIGSNGAFHWEYTCGACGCGIMRNDRWKTKYCPQCGKAVKWDD